MNEQEKHLQDLASIRSLMERSSRFISLSGLSGVFAGSYALIGAALAYFYLDFGIQEYYYKKAYLPDGSLNTDFLTFFFLDGLFVLVASLVTGMLFTMRRARKKGQTIWDAVAMRMLINLLIPLGTGGIFCLILLHHHKVELLAPATLLFYGLALLNASKYTLNDIRYLGLSEIVLGLLASYFAGYGLLFWSIGFGVLHIIYGLSMYMKYER